MFRPLKLFKVALILTAFLLALEAESAEAVKLDYSSYSQALTYVDQEGLVDYEGLLQNRGPLDQFARELAELSESRYRSWTGESQIAFWINAYNGLTLLLIIDNYPIEPSFFRSFVYPENSIRQISGAWDEIAFEVLGKPMTLDEIEHEVLRQDFDEPRLHMALVCAARGCPPLRNEPFAGKKLDTQLDDQTREFVQDPEKFRIDFEKKIIFLSKIFDWYGQDFITSYGAVNRFSSRGRKEGAVLNFLSQYLGGKWSQALFDESYSIDYLDYDWSLNDQKYESGD